MTRHRWVIRIVGSLTAGVALTYAVAWGCVLLSPVSRLAWARVPTIGDAQWPRGLQQRGPECARVLRSYDLDRSLAPKRQLVADTYYWTIGWPWPVLHATVREHTVTRTTHDALTVVTLPPDPSNSHLIQRRPLAHRPLWRGFGLSIAMYAGLLLGSECGYRAARRWLRRRGGRCGHCGYDRSGLPDKTVCPECGRV